MRFERSFYCAVQCDCGTKRMAQTTYANQERPSESSRRLSAVCCQRWGEAANTIAATLRSKSVSVTGFTSVTEGVKYSEWRV